MRPHRLVVLGTSTLLSALMIGVLATTPAAHAAAAPTPATVTVAAVGDIACDPTNPVFNGGLGTPAGCRQAAVAAAIAKANPNYFFALGDNQYLNGTLAQYMAVYDKSFGQFKSKTYPIPGNHEYNTPFGKGYYAYFGAVAHEANKGTYSFDIGSWHVLAINSTQCTPTTPCGPTSALGKWIASDLKAHPSVCTLAMWHHPLYSVGTHGEYEPMIPVWNQLEAAGVDVVLNGHDHLYQRFQPLGMAVANPNNTFGVNPPTVDPAKGMVEFVVGTGGEDNYSISSKTDPKTAAALAAKATKPNPAVFGSLLLTLKQGGYSFSFLPAAGTTYTDSGSGTCH